ncbi:MAG: glucose-6-phosphate isomerase [Oscillospiraceae bacterium]|nr:glucose-6-phosphate isomerase [Oscillospiraceae bacterium]
MVTTDISGILDFVEKVDLSGAKRARKKLIGGEYDNYNGWRRIADDYTPELDAHIKNTAAEVIEDSNMLIVIGIGGSYLGARALYDMFASKQNTSVKVIFAGTSLSSREMRNALAAAAVGDFTLNVVSKSGSTFETLLAFRVFYELLCAKYGKDGAKKRIIVTTDPEKGMLRDYAKSEGIRSFAIPSDIGGRYSALTPVALFPMAVAGINPVRFIHGAAEQSTSDDEAIKYAAARAALYKTGKKIELLCSYEPDLGFLESWWRQLFAESEGKNRKGIFPASAGYTTDLHSVGQYVQDGERIIFETMIDYGCGDMLLVPRRSAINDGLDAIAGRDISDFGAIAHKAVKKAHMTGGVPVIDINAGGLSPEHMGALMYFFETACAISAIMQKANPFDQPGVEEYKKNMRELMGL